LDNGSKTRLSSCSQRVSKWLEIIESLHLEACLKEENGYSDPESGNYVMTEYYLKKRGHCCQSGCRHCPYQEMGKKHG
jgi:hypothetical protein